MSGVVHRDRGGGGWNSDRLRSDVALVRGATTRNVTSHPVHHVFTSFRVQLPSAGRCFYLPAGMRQRAMCCLPTVKRWLFRAWVSAQQLTCSNLVFLTGMRAFSRLLQSW